MEWEGKLIESIQTNFGFSGGFAKFLDFFGAETGILMLVLIVTFCYKKEVGQKLALMVSSLNMWLPMIKSVVLRPRPYMEYPDRVKPLALQDKGAAAMDVAAQGYSFPSMHSASVPALYFSLAKEAKKKWLWLLAMVLTILVGVSRVVAGMHYPTDVLAGWILGFAVMGIFTLLDRYVKKEQLYNLILLVSVLPGILYVRTTDYYTSLGCLIGAIAAIPFERKFVNFQGTRRIPAMLLRVLGAVIIYFVLNTLLKLPFDKQFLAGTSLAAFLIRTVRYAIIMFLLMGVYPMVFPRFEKN
ncbi:MAG: phosphatase PAP2 family protein [Oribacterium sp.]|nr:phosphatase PAP2 family protein [Oribacterium sp.]